MSHRHWTIEAYRILCLWRSVSRGDLATVDGWIWRNSEKVEKHIYWLAKMRIKGGMYEPRMEETIGRRGRS